MKKSYSLVPVSELLIFYCASQCPHLLSSKVVKYGKMYLELHYSEVDKIVFWVDEMRERYYGTEGEGIFENATLIMFSNNQTGMIHRIITLNLLSVATVHFDADASSTSSAPINSAQAIIPNSLKGMVMLHLKIEIGHVIKNYFNNTAS